MVTEEIAPGVYFVEASKTNFAILVEGRDITLIDSGYPKDRALVDAAVQEIGRSLADVHAMLLTHAHPDHKGSAERLRHDYGVTILCHTDEAPIAQGELKQQISLREIWRAWRPPIFAFTVNALRSGGLTVEHVKEVSTIPGDAPLDIPGHPVPVHTPGHTQGHVVVHLPDRGVLLTGDALLTVDIWDPRRDGPQVIRPPFCHDYSQAVRSLDELLPLDADIIAPGHGRPWRGSPKAAVAIARGRL